MSPRRNTIIGGLVVAALALAACGSDEQADDRGREGSTETPSPTTAPGHGTGTAGAGWIDGEPPWGGSGEMTAADAGAGAAPALSEAATDAGTERGTIGDEPGEEIATGPLRAGSVDDNADFERYLAYLDRIDSLGIPLRDFDPTGRIVAAVTGADGLPVAGAEVVVSAEGAEAARLRTTADGTVRFHPALHGAGAATYTFEAEGVSGDAAPGEGVELVTGEPGGAEPPVALDVLFLLDATGSMGDEIDQLKVSIDSVAERIAALDAAPDVRFAMTLYRDLDDDFVTATYDFTGDVDEFRTALAEVVAAGGGDYPEALDEGLAEALTVPSWRDPATTVQHVFLVADAPPHVGRQVEMPYPDSIREAVGRGVKIFPVASSESDDQAEAVFRQLAQATGARFVFLAYGAAGAATGGSTDIDRTDYEELALDDLVVRLVAEDLAALTGDPDAVPDPTPTTTPVPDGQ